MGRSAQTNGIIGGGRPGKSTQKIDPEKLKKNVPEHPDAYLKEIAEVFSCSSAAIDKALKRLHINRKKRRPGTENKTLPR